MNSILRKNRKILRELNVNGIERVRREELQRAGFDFTYHTNTYQTVRGRMYKFCYDQGYLDMEGAYITLVEKKDYVG